MKNARHLALILFFLGLAALEIAHGVFRLDAIRERQRRGFRERIERDHRELAGELRDLLAEKREHAAYLSRTPAVSALLAAPGDAGVRRELESFLLPYLVSFGSIDRVRILDAGGGEVFRCERIGGAAGVLPVSLLTAEPDSGILELARELPPGDVAVSPLSVDRGRVEVPECDRQVLHYAARVDVDGGRGGIVVLTVYAQPLLEGVRQFSPLDGVNAAVVDTQGKLVSDAASFAPSGEDGLQLFAKHQPVASRLVAGATRVEADGVTYMGLEVHRRPKWLLVCRVPDRALEAASGDVRGEYAWITGTTVTVTAVIAIVAGILVRLSVRELRLRERDRYLEFERRLRVSERLGSLGLLTAGVAHEINNPLEAIGNYLALLDRERLPEENRKRYVGLVRHGFDRIRDIVRDLSGFTRPEDHGGMAADIAHVVRRALGMVRYSQGFRRIEVELVGLDGPVRVTGEGGRLEQVFINLLLNGARAAGDQGRVRIEARRIRDDATPASAANPLVEILVEDDGPGIPEEDLGRIFDPFFTRTAPGVDRSSLGLGLFISYGIIDAHGGTLWAENRAEGGARFVIRLPAANEALEVGTARREAGETG